MSLNQSLLLVCLAIIAYAQAVEDTESTKLQSEQQSWRQSEDEIIPRDSDSVPSESQNTRSNFQDHPNNGPLLEQDRPRQRNRSRSNGKRRRRMRKRPRTTTPEPYADDAWETPLESQTAEESLLNKPRFQSERIQDNIRDLPIEEQEEIKPQPRRRPGRRRRPNRRPYKTEDRYEDSLNERNVDEAAKSEIIEERRPQPTTQGRKRRKGSGRKRIRIETELPIIETSSSSTIVEPIQEDSNTTYDESHSKGYIGTIANIESNTEQLAFTTQPEYIETKPGDNFTMSTSTTQQEPSELIITEATATTLPDITNETHAFVTSENQHTEIHYSTTFSTRHTSDPSSETTKVESTSDRSKEPSSSTEAIVETTTSTQQTKPLLSRFSSKHKLHSRISGELLKTVSSTEQPKEHSTENVQDIKPFESEMKVEQKVLVSSPRKLPPTSANIRRRLKQKYNNTISNDNEEPLVTAHLNTAKKYRQRLEHKNRIEPSLLLPTGFKTNPEILSPMKLLEEVTLNEVLKMMTSTTEPSSEEQYTTIKTEKNEIQSSRLNLDGIDLPNIRDEILDLIKSESGSTRLARILELRNMTLTELLDHRERGSSQLYFSENFNKRSKETTTVTTPTPTKKFPRTTPKDETEPTTIIIPKTVKPFLPRTAKTTPRTKLTTKVMTTTQRYEAPTKSENFETTFDIESREKPSMNVEASIISVPILEPTHTSNIQFPSQGVQTKFPKYTEILQHEEVKTTKQPKFEDRMIGAASKTRLYAFITETNDDEEYENGKRKPRLFDSMQHFLPNKTIDIKIPINKHNKTFFNWKSQFQSDPVKPFKGEHKELMIAVTTGPSKQVNVEDILLYNERDESLHSNIEGNVLDDIENLRTNEDDYSGEVRRLPHGVKSAILASGAILGLAILIFLTVLVSCRLRQKNARLRGKRDILCEQLQEDFRSSQCSLSPVLRKSHRTVFRQGIHSNTTSNRHYYLWRTLRKTFQYE